jgi:phenylpropionate dioxygenase-like ring-hydroxylating dioxygenase large terminal subunit
MEATTMTVLHKPKPRSAAPRDWVVEDIPAGTFRVNRAALVDEAVFRDEMRSIFDRCWLYVGHESEIPQPGDFRARDVGNRPLVFWHGHDGVKRVFCNSCRHRGALVCRVPEGNAKTMNCFYHAWTYGSTGALSGLPGEEGYGPTFDRASMGLLSPAQVDNYRGFVFACFDPGAVDLRTYLAGAAEYSDLVADQAEAMEVVAGAHEYSADANWKLFVENSVDGYHLLPVHITYFEYLEKAEGVRPNLGDLNEAIDLGNGHAVLQFGGPWARPVARWTPVLGERNRKRVEAAYAELVRKHGPERADLIARVDRNVMIFPNLIILDVMGVVVRKLAPTSAGHTRITQWSLATAGEGADLRARRLENFITFQGPGGFATPDDLEALEACQAGFRAGAGVPWSDISRGMHLERSRQPCGTSDERQMRAFWRQWQKLMGVG